MGPFWTPEDLKNLEPCSSFPCLSDKAMLVLEKMQPGPVAMVCGPISTGGLCSVEKNLEVLDKAVANLKSQNIKV
ncbi:MAG: hypothetical protein Q7S12_01980, partial [bacterium]|nr:hypothetical protein [bacterium]